MGHANVPILRLNVLCYEWKQCHLLGMITALFLVVVPKGSHKPSLELMILESKADR